MVTRPNASVRGGISATAIFPKKNEPPQNRESTTSQNQSLADSHADLAQDLRNEVYRMLTAGQTDRQIIDFLVARYGEFVLYRPPVSPLTWLLWFGPALLLLIAGGVWWRIARTRSDLPPRDSGEDAAVAALTGKSPESP